MVGVLRPQRPVNDKPSQVSLQPLFQAGRIYKLFTPKDNPGREIGTQMVWALKSHQKCKKYAMRTLPEKKGEM
jgi:hypothetical protein